MTDDEKRRPDGPTEPPDQHMGTRRRGGESKVESKASRGVGECPGEVGDDAKQPGTLEEPPGEAQVETPDPNDVQVEPGGETGEVEPDGNVAHEDADADFNGDAC